MKEYKLLIFDWDGTLANSMDFIVECLKATAREFGVAELNDEELRSGIGLAAADHLEKIIPNADKKSLTDCFYKNYFQGGEKTERAYEGAFETLRELKISGYTLAVATNKGRKGLDAALVRMKAADLFAATRCGDEGVTKPHPDVILGLLEKLDFEPHHTLMIGDTVHDMQLAKNAGVDALAVTYGVGKHEHFAEYSPIKCINDIRDLHQLLISSGKK